MKSLLVIFRMLCCIMILYFGMASLLQLNDPDRIIGLSLYFGSILVTFTALFKRTNLAIFGLMTIILSVISIYWWVIFILNWNSCVPLQFEMCSPGQHSFGFSISALWVLALTIYGFRTTSSNDLVKRYFYFLKTEETENLIA